MKITIVAGARPNFMKIAPIIAAIEKQASAGKDISYRLVHTGQHYDKNLSDTFFEELNIPKPHSNLEVKSGSQARQTGAIMERFEEELANNRPDVVLVVGDVTSTMACAIVAKKAHVDVVHVEAGIRSGDRKMPEEINRIVTDSITDYFYTTTPEASQNLLDVGIRKNQVYLVGNVMIDTLLGNLDRLKKPDFWDEYSLKNKEYYVMTLHRPSNVDQANDLRALIQVIMKRAGDKSVIFPVHPRTLKMLRQLDLSHKNLHFVTPQGYLSFIYLIKNAFGVLTDSGGITEETTVLNVPCLTFRDSTERPETCVLGTNILVGQDLNLIEKAFDNLQANSWPQAQEIPLWDGKAATRIVQSLMAIYEA
jgi:UDP-N-acetylglucosamine 2-epimerase (non-hydrolysing)